MPILYTKLYVPQPRVNRVLRTRLLEQLDKGFQHKVILVSAPAGFGKTMLVSEWVSQKEQSVAWLSLDEGDSDPIRFLTYIVAALQSIAPEVGTGILGVLESSQPPAAKAILTDLLNEITNIPNVFVLVIDDYHLIDSKSVDDALAFLVEHLPPKMHLVIATREDPQIPLARLRARDELTEIRVSDLSFTLPEAAEFLNQVMGLNISVEDVAALVSRTEGWVAGLQLAALSMQGHSESASFIQSFTGSHRYVLDYLLEEVLQQQSERVQAFLMCTSILDRLCNDLCEAVLGAPCGSAQEILDYLDHANLFIVPLDSERHWYRYHHLFAELLRQRLRQQQPDGVADLHRRASLWYEDHGLEIEAFQHATAANDIERATRLIQGKDIPLHIRGGLVPVLNWLGTLPTELLDERPILWIMYAGALTTAGQTTGVEQKLQAAEAALQGVALDSETRDLIGRIANNRATLAVSQYQSDLAIAQAQRALEYLRPDNLPVRTITTWVLGVAYSFKGERIAAGKAFADAISISQAIGQTFVTKLATIGLGNIQEVENQLFLATETYQRSLQLFGDQPLPFACEAYLGLARIFYEWNDLKAAQNFAQQSILLARQYADIIDRSVVSEVFLARLRLALGDVTGAHAILDQADLTARQRNFIHRFPEIAAARVMAMIYQGDLLAAGELAQAHELPLCQARVYLARGEPAAALNVLKSWRQQVEVKGWADEILKVLVVQALAHHALGEKDQALHTLGDALALARPGGYIRTFTDEGLPMAQLLSEASTKGIMTDYVDQLLAAFEARTPKDGDQLKLSQVQLQIEPLSRRELEVLRLIAQGLSNREICQRLYLALNTVKGHNRIIFDKLQVKSRTEAVARARQLGLL